MKKTKATALTAAIFAAAMSSAACGNVTQAGEKEGSELYAKPLNNQIVAADAENVTTTYSPTATTIPTLYGPPWVFDKDYNDGEITTEDPSINEEDPTDPYFEDETTEPDTKYDEPEFQPETTLPEPLYGPPQLEIEGDFNLDGVVDAFDLTLMRMVYNNPNDSFYYYNDIIYDLDKNGKFDLRDINVLNKYLTGEIKSFDDIPDPTEPPTEEVTTVPEPVTDPMPNTTVPTLYGPPWVFGY